MTITTHTLSRTHTQTQEVFDGFLATVTAALVNADAFFDAVMALVQWVLRSLPVGLLPDPAALCTKGGVDYCHFSKVSTHSHTHTVTERWFVLLRASLVELVRRSSVAAAAAREHVCAETRGLRAAAAAGGLAARVR